MSQTTIVIDHHVDPWTFYRGLFVLESNMRGTVAGLMCILIFIRLQWLVAVLVWKIRSYRRFSNKVPASGPVTKLQGQDCDCRRINRLVFVTAVMSNPSEKIWHRSVLCPKCGHQTNKLELVHAKILDEDACARFTDCYCRKTACLLYAIEKYPRDYLVCLDLDVIMDDELIGNICSSPLHQTPAWFSPPVCEDPVEPYFFNALISYFWTFLLVIGVRFAYLKDPFLAGKFMILHAPFFHDCFTMRQLERIWGRAISEDFRLANILKTHCGRTPQILEWPVYTRKGTTPATAALLWTKSRRWMQGAHTTTIRRILFFAILHKPVLVFPFLWFDILDNYNVVYLYSLLMLCEILGVTAAGRSPTPLRFLQVAMSAFVWEAILPWMFVAWNVSDRFTWYKRTYVMNRFDDEMLYVMDTEEIPEDLKCSPIFAVATGFPLAEHNVAFPSSVEQELRPIDAGESASTVHNCLQVENGQEVPPLFPSTVTSPTEPCA